MAILRKCRGLHTFNNELNEVEGALNTADNVVIDANDVIESRRGFSEYGDVANQNVDQVLGYKRRILRHQDGLLQFDDGAGSFTSFSGSYQAPEGVQRIKYMEGKGNLLFTSNEGIKKISANNASQLTSNADYITNAGGVKAVDLTALVAPQIGGFLPPQSKVAYKILWGIKDNNGNLIYGSPSSRALVTNTSIDSTISEQFTVDFAANEEGDLAGKYMLFSSTTTDYVLWWSNAGVTAPITDETLGRQYIEVDITGFGAATQSITNSTADAIASIGAFGVEIDLTILTITSTISGENLADAAAGDSGLTVGVSDGVTNEGSPAVVNVTFTVPNDVNNTNHFYQLYRTAVSTVPIGLTLDDIDPGEEMNLVFEQGITSAEIASKEVSIEDITPEDFRASGTLLYVNPISGQGILQANERPPIAKDVELFRDTVFYANTKTVHRLNLDMLSATGFTTGVTELVVGNDEVTREYLFVGTTETGTIVCDSFANTTENGYILLKSARNERSYYVWFDKGTGVDPVVAGRIGIRVKLIATDTDVESALKVTAALNGTSDFGAIATLGTVDFSNVKNGYTDNAALGATSPGGLWSATSSGGTGEDTIGGDILISSDSSTAQSIDEMARSIVKVINSDSLSPISAYYISNADDLPGKMRFENKNQEDRPYYIGINEVTPATKFSPELSVVQTLTAIDTGNPSNITAASHDVATGDTVYFYNTDSTPAILGAYEATYVDANTFSIPVNVIGAGTTGLWFKGDVASDNDENPNRIYYSKTGIHEAVPIVNFLDIGPKDKAIQRIIALRDNLFVLKEDGVYIVTGSSAPNFGSRALDNSTEIIAPDTAAVLNNQIFALTSQGVVTITEGGVSIISRPIENLILGIANARYDYALKSFGVTYESDRAYLLWLPTTIGDTISTQCYRYNIFTSTWTRWTKPATCGVINPVDDKLYLGGDNNFLLQERKNDNRTDHSDEEYSLSILSDSVDGTTIKVSTAQGVTIGDVMLQEQYVSISFLRRMLVRLDIDGGLDDTDYATLTPSVGASMSATLDTLNAKLIADDTSGIITDHTPFSNDFSIMATEFNAMIDELNNSSTDTLIQDYDKAETIVPYEILVTEVDINTNSVTVNLTAPLLEGAITMFKGFEFEVEWVPQHFGSPDSLKQVREGTVMFDQNNFYTAQVSFASDLNQDFIPVDVVGRGVGDFGVNNFGGETFGGSGNDVPVRFYTPLEKMRCRYLTVKFTHVNAREEITILGITLEPRLLSKRAYR